MEGNDNVDNSTPFESIIKLYLFLLIYFFNITINYLQIKLNLVYGIIPSHAIGGSTVKLIIPSLILTLLITMSFNGIAEVVEVDDKFKIEYDDSTLTLKPDEEVVIQITIENIDNKTWNVALRFTKKQSGNTVAEIQPSIFYLEPGSSEVVNISIQTRADYGQSPGSSNFKITIYWGEDIIQYPNTWVDLDTVEGEWRIRFHVIDDFLFINTILISIILLVIIITLYIGLRIRRRRTD